MDQKEPTTAAEEPTAAAEASTTVAEAPTTAAEEPAAAAEEPTTAAEEAVHRRDVVVVGASAGGVEALATLVRGLPADFPAAVLVVLHLTASGRSMLAEILDRSGALAARSAVDGEHIVPGRIYVAPPDRHMLLHDGALRVVRGPRENGHRPAIDPLFRTAARARGTRVIGVILSGLLDDGAAGLRCVKRYGGATVVQDPDDALFTAMPLAAKAATEVDCLTSAGEMAAALQRLATERVAWQADPAANGRGGGRDSVERDPSELSLVEGEPSSLSCPACGGAIWESLDGNVVRFTCQVGHAYTAQSMLAEQGTAVEAAMWSALRSLEERSQLLRRIAQRQSGASRERFERRAAEAVEHARRIREVLLGQPPLDPSDGTDA
jgi:two-component system chemotaxis response regulator CheB